MLRLRSSFVRCAASFVRTVIGIICAHTTRANTHTNYNIMRLKQLAARPRALPQVCGCEHRTHTQTAKLFVCERARVCDKRAATEYNNCRRRRRNAVGLSSNIPIHNNVCVNLRPVCVCVCVVLMWEPAWRVHTLRAVHAAKFVDIRSNNTAAGAERGSDVAQCEHPRRSQHR